MKIDDSMRGEQQPRFVYSICQLLAEKSLSQEQIVSLLAPAPLGKSEKSKYGARPEYVTKTLTFAKRSGMVIEDKQGNYRTDFNTQELSEFQRFTYRILKEAGQHTDTAFFQLCQWLMVQPAEQIYYRSANELQKAEQPSLGLGDEKIGGAVAWLIATGMFTPDLSPSRNANSFFLTLHRPLRKWLRYECVEQHALPLGKYIGMTNFLQTLQQIFPFLSIDFAQHTLSPVLCAALEILAQSHDLQFVYTADSTDRWQFHQVLPGAVDEATDVKVMQHE